MITYSLAFGTGMNSLLVGIVVVTFLFNNFFLRVSSTYQMSLTPILISLWSICIRYSISCLQGLPKLRGSVGNVFGTVLPPHGSGSHEMVFPRVISFNRLWISGSGSSDVDSVVVLREQGFLWSFLT